MFKEIGGGIGRAQHFDIKALKQLPRVEFRRGEFFNDAVVELVSVFCVWAFIHTKD